MTNRYILDSEVNERYLYLFNDGACRFVTYVTYLDSKNSSILHLLWIKCFYNLFST